MDPHVLSFPKIIWFYGFAITKQIVQPNNGGIHPRNLFYHPPDHIMVKPGYLVEWTAHDTQRTRESIVGPELEALFSVDGPF